MACHLPALQAITSASLTYCQLVLFSEILIKMKKKNSFKIVFENVVFKMPAVLF